MSEAGRKRWIALGLCVAAAMLLVALGGTTSPPAPSENLESVSAEYENPMQEFRRTSHTYIVHDLHGANEMVENNVKVAVPCSFGIECKLHVRPTLIEKTDGAWLHEGSDYGGSGAAQSVDIRPGSRSTSTAPETVDGPWASAVPKSKPHTASHPEAQPQPNMQEQATSTPDKQDVEDEAEEEKVKLLKAAEARIKARVGKLLGSYSDASER